MWHPLLEFAIITTNNWATTNRLKNSTVFFNDNPICITKTPWRILASTHKLAFTRASELWIHAEIDVLKSAIEGKINCKVTYMFSDKEQKAIFFGIDNYQNIYLLLAAPTLQQWCFSSMHLGH